MPEPFIDYDSKRGLWRALMRFAVPIKSNKDFRNNINYPAVNSPEITRHAINCGVINCHEVKSRVDQACESPVEASIDAADVNAVVGLYPREVNVNLSAYFQSKEEAESGQTRELLARHVEKVTAALGGPQVADSKTNPLSPEGKQRRQTITDANRV